MNGPEHYRRAEALLDSCQMPGGPDVDEQCRSVETYSQVLEDCGGDEPTDSCRNALMAAQVHATLALAAAAALAPSGYEPDGDRARAWREAIR